MLGAEGMSSHPECEWWAGVKSKWPSYHTESWILFWNLEGTIGGCLNWWMLKLDQVCLSNTVEHGLEGRQAEAANKQTSSKAAGACRVFSREITLPSQWCGPRGLPGSALVLFLSLPWSGLRYKDPKKTCFTGNISEFAWVWNIFIVPSHFSLLLLSFFFIWLHWVLVPARRIFSCSLQTPGCGMWDLDPWPGMEPRTLHREWGVLATGPPGKSLRPHSRQRELPSEPQALLHCLVVTAACFSFLGPHIWKNEPLRFSAASHSSPLAFSSSLACIKFYLPTCFFFPNSAHGWHPFIYQIWAQICQFWRVFPY